MSADDAALVTSARQSLGQAYLGRPLRRVELARLLGLGADYLARVEKGCVPLGGPSRVVLGMLLAGHRSPWHEQALASRHGRGRPVPGVGCDREGTSSASPHAGNAQCDQLPQPIGSNWD